MEGTEDPALWGYTYKRGAMATTALYIYSAPLHVVLTTVLDKGRNSA